MSRPRPAPGTVYSLSEEETLELGRTIGAHLSGGELILLVGELGLGKTVFARGVAIGLGIAAQEVRSPSFALVQQYDGGRRTMFHIDLYRLESLEDMETLGLEETLASGGVVVVEWGERLPVSLRRDGLIVRFHDLGQDSRRIEFGAGEAVPIPGIVGRLSVPFSRGGSSALPW